METWSAIAVAAFTLLAWGGQVIVTFAPSLGVRLGLSEAEDEVEPVFWADGRAEAAWDALVLWTLPVAGLLLAFGHDAWPYFAMVGGGQYLYFGGRGILVRLEMRRRGFRVGPPANLKVGVIALALWGATGAGMAAAGAMHLAGN